VSASLPFGALRYGRGSLLCTTWISPFLPPQRGRNWTRKGGHDWKRFDTTDGDTIRHDGVVYRLWGIDAPELSDRCGDWPAGIVARDWLAALMAGRAVACQARDRDRWGRVVALCRAEGVDLSAAMVREGLVK